MALAVLGMAGTISAFWPGIMVWDAIRQYGQALAGSYDDWHPPAMAAAWRAASGIAPGPAPMLVLQATLYWGGLALLAAARRGGPGLAAAIVAIGWLPIPYVLVGTILKDSLMAGALASAAGLIALRRTGDQLMAAAAVALLVAAATLRFNAVPACLPLALLLTPASWRASRERRVATAAVAALALAAALPLANRALHARASGVELSLVIYDLGGITRFAGVDAFPPLAVADPVAVNRACYTPVSWDSYAWWGSDPCPIGFGGVRAAFASQHRSPVRWWLGAIAAHPLAYAQHRLAHADRTLRFWTKDGALPTLSLASDPNPWGYAVGGGWLKTAVGDLALVSLTTPLGWPVCWMAVVAGCLMMRPCGLAAALAWSALLYGLSYVPLGVASEVRYHFWTMTAAALAAVLTLADREARGRAVPAAALVTVVSLAAVAARLL